MNNKIIFSFVAGAAIGSVTTYFIVKDKFEKLAQTEIDSVKEAFSRLHADKKEYETIAAMYKEPISNAQFVCETEDYSDKETEIDAPYVISPDEVDEFGDYETIELIYYADGILADDGNEIIDDVEGTVGEDSLERFGEYEPDSVYVRNDKRKCDYVILLDERRYSDVTGPKTYRTVTNDPKQIP